MLLLVRVTRQADRLLGKRRLIVPLVTLGALLMLRRLVQAWKLRHGVARRAARRGRDASGAVGTVTARASAGDIVVQRLRLLGMAALTTHLGAARPRVRRMTAHTVLVTRWSSAVGFGMTAPTRRHHRGGMRVVAALTILMPVPNLPSGLCMAGPTWRSWLRQVMR